MVSSLFTVLTILFGVMLALPRFWRRFAEKRILVIAHVVFLAVYAVGLVLMVRSAHQGGLLVHQPGMHGPPAPAAAAPVSSRTETERE